MMLNPKETIAVLVTYQPDEAVAARIQKHLEQFDHIIVVDNGALEPAALLPKHKQVTLLCQPENNLAAAQNLGICRAQTRGAAAAVLLDDDSELSPGALAALCSAWREGDGLIAPALLEDGREMRQASPWLQLLFQRRFAPSEGCFTPIASGSLIPMRVLQQVGLMDASLGIDYVDRDFCLRLLQRGYQTRVISGAQLHHRLGRSRDEWLGMRSRNHTPARRRSIFRNRLRCWSRYGLSCPSFLLYDVLATGYDLFRITFFEEQKAAKFRAIMDGVMDALLKR